MSRQRPNLDLIQQLRSEIMGYFGAASAFDERVAKRFKLSRGDMRWLELLDRQGSMTAGQLSDESGLTTGAVTFLLDRLEGAGMVVRRRDPDDRRRVWVELTPTALKRIQQTQAPIQAEMRELAQRFKAEELAIVRDFMRGAKEVFQRQVSGERHDRGAPSGAHGGREGPVG